MMRHVGACLISAALLAGVPLSAVSQDLADTAQAFPQQPLTILVPRGRGGGSHQLSTAVAAGLRQALGGVEVNVENKPDEHGKDAIEYFITQPPNGYTILQHVDGIASFFAEREIATDPTKDLVPLAIAQRAFSQLYIRDTEHRFGDWTSFLEYVREHPGQVEIAIVGHAGSMESVLLEMLERNLDICFRYEPFNKPVDRYLSLVEKKVDALVEQPGDVVPFLDLKLIKPILTLLPARPAEFPDTPSLNDVPGDFLELYRFRAFFVHADVPAPVLQKLETAMGEVLASPEFEEFNTRKYMHVDAKYRNIEGALGLVRATIDTYRHLDAQDWSNACPGRQGAPGP